MKAYVELGGVLNSHGMIWIHHCGSIQPSTSLSYWSVDQHRPGTLGSRDMEAQQYIFFRTKTCCTQAKRTYMAKTVRMLYEPDLGTWGNWHRQHGSTGLMTVLCVNLLTICPKLSSKDELSKDVSTVLSLGRSDLVMAWRVSLDVWRFQELKYMVQ